MLKHYKYRYTDIVLMITCGLSVIFTVVNALLNPTWWSLLSFVSSSTILGAKVLLFAVSATTLRLRRKNLKKLG